MLRPLPLQMRFTALGQIFCSLYMSQSYTLTYRLIEDLNICSKVDLILEHLRKAQKIIVLLFRIRMEMQAGFFRFSRFSFLCIKK